MQKIVTTTAKIQKFHTIPCKEVPRKCTVSADSGTNRQKICRDGAPSHPPSPPCPRPHQKKISRKNTRNFPIEKSVYEKPQKIQNIYNFFSSDILQKDDVNQMKST